MDNRLNIAFYWHMHQPLYKDPFSGEYVLPWVMLHATKDYYDMVAILDDFPEIHQTFNLVPSLIDQMQDYASGRAKDQLLSITKKRADALTPEDKLFIVERFFQANWHCMIKPMERYWELLLKRGFSGAKNDLANCVRYFNTHDFLDLQVLFNLAWIDPQTITDDKELSRLRKKGKGFSEEDKALLLGKQMDIVKMVIPKYSELAKRGTIELTTSPYFHPILPLLCDTESAREAEPYITLPENRFRHPEDALAQLKMAVELHTDTFGAPPKGLWPSEGSVSMDMLPFVKECGFEWLATDEEILVHSLGRELARDKYGNSKDAFIYRPYSIDVGGGKLDMVFRDHKLSDLIGFDYAKWDPDKAADNLITRLTHIADMVDNPAEHVVSIILDGENAWETYRNDGWDFLSDLYTKLTGHKRLKCVSVGEFLTPERQTDKLQRVFSGSWISHNFRVWIGHSEDNTAWDLLNDARAVLTKAEADDFDASRLKEARSALYAAEGSDWFWWYGDIHSSENDEVFDLLFRRYVKKVYTALGLEAPLTLDAPIIGEVSGVVPDNRPSRFIEPVIDGMITNYFEWYSAGFIKKTGFGGAMHTTGDYEGLLDGISYGFSLESIFFRFDYLVHLVPYKEKWSCTLYVIHPRAIKIYVEIEADTVKTTIFESGEDGWLEREDGLEVASKDCVELGVPFDLTGASVGEEVGFYFEIDSGERGHERWPAKGYLILPRPGENFEDEDWSV